MARRPHLMRLECRQEGCREVAHYEYPTVSEFREAARRHAQDPYYCSRHRAPNEVLSPENRTREIIKVVKWGEGTYISDQLFWASEGGRPTSGFQFGPGFKAWAKDFPVGTRLIVTARIELPEEEPT